MVRMTKIEIKIVTMLMMSRMKHLFIREAVQPRQVIPSEATDMLLLKVGYFPPLKSSNWPKRNLGSNDETKKRPFFLHHPPPSLKASPLFFCKCNLEPGTSNDGDSCPTKRLLLCLLLLTLHSCSSQPRFLPNSSQSQ